MDRLYFYKQKVIAPAKFFIERIVYWFVVNFWPQMILDSIKKLDLTGTEVDRHLLLSGSYYVSGTSYNSDTRAMTIFFTGKVPDELKEQIVKAIGYKHQLTIDTL